VDLKEVTAESALRVPIYNRASGHPHPSANVFEISLDLVPEDFVYLQGQAEVNWIGGLKVSEQLFAIRIADQTTSQPGCWASANIGSSMEHLPLQVSTLQRVKSPGQATFVLNAHAGTDQPLDVGKYLPVPPGCGHLYAEVYRSAKGVAMQRFLVDIQESRQELRPELRIAPAGPSAGQYSENIYKLSLSLRNGDKVYLEGQVEATNDQPNSVGFAVEIKNDQVPDYISYSSSHWITPQEHHLPLRVSTLYTATKDGPVTFFVNAHAWGERAEVNKILTVESGYGNLLAKVYREI
jgi:hypothetical protein